MADATLKNYHHGDLRRALLVAAQTMLDSAGVEAVTVRAVARKAGVAHSAPANHFKNRTALLTALAINIFEDLSRAIEYALGKANPTTQEQLHVFGNIMVQFAINYPNRYRLIWRRDSLDNSDGQLDKAGTALYMHIHNILSFARSNKILSLDSEIIAIWSMIHGYISLRLDGTLIAGNDELTGCKRADAIIDVLISGIGVADAK